MNKLQDDYLEKYLPEEQCQRELEILKREMAFACDYWHKVCQLILTLLVWLIDWLTHSKIDWLIDWLTDWFYGWLINGQGVFAHNCHTHPLSKTLQFQNTSQIKLTLKTNDISTVRRPFSNWKVTLFCMRLNIYNRF